MEQGEEKMPEISNGLPIKPSSSQPNIKSANLTVGRYGN